MPPRSQPPTLGAVPPRKARIKNPDRAVIEFITARSANYRYRKPAISCLPTEDPGNGSASFASS